ncbi:hypothetical protein ACHWQZ_G017529 [Mnemiopsis leidyi]
MEERSVLIKMRDGEYLIVPKDQLTTNSPKFRHIFDVLKYEEHEIEDFSSEAVKTFIEFLGSKVADRLTFHSFREICKLAVVFEVNWLKEECLEWLKSKMFADSFYEKTIGLEKTFIFEECLFMLDKWADDTMMNEFLSVFAHENNTLLLFGYLSDITKLKTSQIDPLLKLGGENVELFLKSILQNLTDQKTLDPKLKYLLQNLNLALCSEVNEELYLEVMDTVSNLSEISVADLRFVQQLTTNTARLVRSRKQERMTRKATVLWDSSNKIFPHLLKSLGNIIQAITDDRVLSMFVATEMILLTFDLIDPDFDIEEPDAFILNIEKLCSDKKMQRVSRKFLNEIISALKYSNASQNKLNHVHYLLKKIKNNNKLCANYENIVIPRQDYAFKDNDHQYLYFFKHPLSGNW